MYALTLTSTEIESIHIVSARGYARSIAAILDECEREPRDDGDPSRYLVPEHMAWAVDQEAEHGSFGPISPTLREKLLAFCDCLI